MASRPLYSVSFLGSTKNYYVGVSADPGESFRQLGEMIEDFKAQGLTLGNYLYLQDPGGLPVGFSSLLRGDFTIVSTLGPGWWPSTPLA